MTVPNPVENRSKLDSSTFQELARLLMRQTSIKHGLDWILSLSPPGRPVDVVAQDEFSHDVLFELPPDLWLVYSCT